VLVFQHNKCDIKCTVHTTLLKHTFLEEDGGSHLSYHSFNLNLISVSYVIMYSCILALLVELLSYGNVSMELNDSDSVAMLFPIKCSKQVLSKNGMV
jgi:hypothetical protein